MTPIVGASRDLGAPCAPETAFLGGVLQRRPCSANVIHGHGDHSVLGRWKPSSFFLQAMEDLLRSRPRVFAGFAPSGSSPVTSPAPGSGDHGSAAVVTRDLIAFQVYLFGSFLQRWRTLL